MLTKANFLGSARDLVLAIATHPAALHRGAAAVGGVSLLALGRRRSSGDDGGDIRAGGRKQEILDEAERSRYCLASSVFIRREAPYEAREAAEGRQSTGGFDARRRVAPC